MKKLFLLSALALCFVMPLNKGTEAKCFSCADIEAITWQQEFGTCMQNQDPNYPEVCYWVADTNTHAALQAAGCVTQ